MRSFDTALASFPNRMYRRTALMRLGCMSAPDIHPTGIGRVGQDTAHTGCIPKFAPARGSDPQLMQMFNQTVERSIFLQVKGKHLTHHTGFRFVDGDFAGISGGFRINMKSIRGSTPGQQNAGSVFSLAPTSHSICNQCAFVFGDCASDLQNQLVMRILAHRTVQKFDPTSIFLQLFQQQHLVNIVPSQAIWGRHHDAVYLPSGDAIPQSIQTWPVKGCPAETIISEDIFNRQFPALLIGIGHQPFQLLFNRLSLCLTLGRYPRINRYSHAAPPGRFVSDPVWRNELSLVLTNKLDPTGSVRLGTPVPSGEFSTGVSWLPPHSDSSDAEYTFSPVTGMRNRNGRRDQFSSNRLVRVMQNLSFVIRPLKKISWMINRLVSNWSPAKFVMPMPWLVWGWFWLQRHFIWLAPARPWLRWVCVLTSIPTGSVD